MICNIAGVLVDLHRSSDGVTCNQVNMDTVQQVMAAKWAVDVINNQSLPHELHIGEYIIIVTLLQWCGEQILTPANHNLR